tara:strand:+ start:115 stop:780 length:666 start_codon:yes stop_codon:yes gene_type:complete
MSLIPIYSPYSASVPPSANYLDTANSTAGGTIFTFEDMDLGTAGATRNIVVGFSGQGTGLAQPSSITVAGVTATIDIGLAIGTEHELGLAHAEVPSGTSGDVVVTWPQAASLRCGVQIFNFFGMSTTLSDSASDGANVCSANIDVPAGGFAFGYCYAYNNGGAGTIVWTGLTEDNEAPVGNYEQGAAHKGFSSAQDQLEVTMTVSSPLASLEGMVITSFGP